MEKLGYENLKELVVCGLSVGNALGHSLEDGKFDLTDSLKFIPVLRTIGPAVEDVDQVMAELSNLDEKEYGELMEHVKETFDIPQEELEHIVELGLAAAIKIAQLVSVFTKKKGM